MDSSSSLTNRSFALYLIRGAIRNLLVKRLRE